MTNARCFDHEGLGQLQNICQLLPCYIFARESIATLICSVAMSLYDIIDREEVEDVGHFVVRCKYVAEERLMGERAEGWHEMESNENVVMMMDRACRDEAVARAVERMWRKRFVMYMWYHPSPGLI